MKNPFFEKHCRYSIRKLSVGACSLMIGSILFAGPVLAEEAVIAENATGTTAVASEQPTTPAPEVLKELEATEDKTSEQPVSEEKPTLDQLTAVDKEATNPVVETPKAEETPATTENKLEEKATVADVPKKEEKSL